MTADHLLSIGGFALVTGLSITALRHYDEVDLLRPASVDPVTGYRRYRPDQVAQARLICALRAVDLPLDAVRRVVRDVEGAATDAVLREHRDRLARRAATVSGLIRQLEEYLEEGIDMSATNETRIVQATINCTDRRQLADFYRAAFGATFNEEIGSFEFGSWPGRQFFLLTIADPDAHPGPAGPARFGLLVDDVDAAHARALAAGAGEVYAPVDRTWKPRSSCVTDPSGNTVDLYQG